MNINELCVKSDAKRKKEQEREDILKVYLGQLSGCGNVIPKPIGVWWWRKCPTCGRHVHKRNYFYGLYVHYICHNPICDYEFAQFYPSDW